MVLVIDRLRERFRELVLGGGAVFVVFDVLTTGVDVFFGVSDVLFPLVALVTGTLSEQFTWLNELPLEPILAVVALAYLFTLLKRLISGIRSEVQE